MSMITLQIDPEFRNKIPPPTKEEYKDLETQLIDQGFDRARGKILVWEGKEVIVDGHTRYKICADHQIPLSEQDIQQKHFSSREEVIQFILHNQLGRRNLTGMDSSVLRAELYESRKRQVGAPEGSQNNPHGCKGKDGTNLTTLVKLDNNVEKNTRKEVAKETGVSAGTIQNDVELNSALNKIQKTTGVDKHAITAGQIKGTRTDVKNLASLPPKQQKQVIKKVTTPPPSPAPIKPIKPIKPPTIKQAIAEVMGKPSKGDAKPQQQAPKEVRLENRRLLPFSDQFAIVVPQSLVTIKGPLDLTRSYTVTLVEEPPKEVLVRETTAKPYEAWTRDELIAAMAKRGGIEFSLAKRTPVTEYITALRVADVKISVKRN